MSETCRNLTLVVPCYNEAARFQAVAFALALEQQPGLRFVFVDDGSTDDTRAVLEKAQAANPDRTSVVTLGSNQGKAEAVRQGMLRALEIAKEHGDEGGLCVGFWDADLATPLDIVPDFLATMAQHDAHAVVGARVKLLGRHIERHAARHYLGRVFATAASVTLGLPIYDTQCGAKIFRVSSALRKAISEPFSVNWSFDVELMSRLLMALGSTALHDTPIVELPLREWFDVTGSKVKPLDFPRGLWELARLYLRTRDRAYRARFGS